MADPRITSFVEGALTQGATRGEIESALQAAGWSSEQVSDALSAFADIEFIVPVPTRKAQFSARDAFLYLVLFSMLYLSAFYLGDLLFQFVNLAFPDEITDSDRRIDRDIRWATATLIVAFPVYLYVSNRISKELKTDPSRRYSPIRKWLTYLTLFIGACVIVGDFIWLLNDLLSGEITVRFFLKTLIVGGIAGSVFWFHLTSLKTDEESVAK